MDPVLAYNQLLHKVNTPDALPSTQVEDYKVVDDVKGILAKGGSTQKINCNLAVCSDLEYDL